MTLGTQGLQEEKLEALTGLERRLGHHTVWLDIEEIDQVVLRDISRLLKFHPVALEGVLHPHQRPKVEIYDDYLVIVARMLARRPTGIESEQLTLILKGNCLITVQQGLPGDSLERVRERLRKGDEKFMRGGADFLAYALLDCLLDSYFPLLEELGEELEQLEGDVLFRITRQAGLRIHEIKRELLALRRAIWPLREALSALLRETVPGLSPETRIFLRDSYDHCVQLIDLVETYRELGSSLMDVYLSSISVKMGEVMKVLTIITTIFVPLTFVAGLYGMNFNTSRSPWNMPELNSPYGYPLCLTGMALVATVELCYFWSKGWLKGTDEAPPSPREGGGGGSTASP